MRPRASYPYRVPSFEASAILTVRKSEQISHQLFDTFRAYPSIRQLSPSSPIDHAAASRVDGVLMTTIRRS